MDTLELYRWAVQDPETHAIVLCTMYERVRPGRHPVVLREDFAGTSAESVAWVVLATGRRAIAIDLDGPTLEWAQRRAVRLLGPLASEIAFVRGDVRIVGPPEVAPADIISVLNFSIFFNTTKGNSTRIFATRSTGWHRMESWCSTSSAERPPPSPAPPDTRSRPHRAFRAKGPFRRSSISGRFGVATTHLSGSIAAFISSFRIRCARTNPRSA